MPTQTTDGRAVSIEIGVAPNEVRWALETAFAPYHPAFTRWDGIVCDEAGLFLRGRLAIDGAEVPLFIEVVYHYRTCWTPFLRDELSAYLDSLGLNGYLRLNGGESRFPSSVASMMEG